MLEEESVLRRVVSGIVQVLVVIALSWLCVYSFGTRAQVTGQSMQPVLDIGDTVLIDRLSMRLRGPRRYDIILFTSPVSGNMSIKRIMGLPGETVQIRGGQLFIDGEPLEDDEEGSLGVVSIAGLAESPLELDEGEYFVLGDNRDISEDSRFETVGNISAGNMAGRVWFRIGPFERIGAVK